MSPPRTGFVRHNTDLTAEYFLAGVLILTITTQIPAEELDAIAKIVAIIIDGSKIKNADDFDFSVSPPTTILHEFLRILTPLLTVSQLFTVSAKVPSFSDDPENAEEYLIETLCNLPSTH